MKMLGIVTVGVVRAPICRVHCAVIFAIAQLSCFHIQRCPGVGAPPLDTPLVPSIRSAIDILMVRQWCGL